MLLNLFQIKYARKSMAYLQIQNDILILCLGTKCVLICRLKFNYVLEPSKLLPWPDIWNSWISLFKKNQLLYYYNFHVLFLKKETRALSGCYLQMLSRNNTLWAWMILFPIKEKPNWIKKFPLLTCVLKNQSSRDVLRGAYKSEVKIQNSMFVAIWAILGEQFSNSFYF